MTDVKKNAWRLPVTLGKYSGVRDEAATPDGADPVKKRMEPPESATPDEDTNIPYRGMGSGVEHGVRPVQDAETFDDQFRQAERAASRTVPVPDPIVEETPFPVKVVSTLPPAREERTFVTDTVNVTDAVQNLLGDDRGRVRLLIRNMSTSAGIVRVGNDENALRTGSGYPVVNSDSLGELEMVTTKAVWVVADTAATVHYLVERIREL